MRKYEQIFHWRITQRKLLNNAQVSTEHHGNGGWKAGTFFRINDYGIQDGIDYHTLTAQNRSLDLDVLHAPPGTVVTGVRFAVDSGVLKMEIRATAFEFNEGRLRDGSANSQWISATINDRLPITIDRPDVPTRSDAQSIPNNEPRKYVQFQPTDKHKDAAQTTVPFLDIQMVEPVHPVPLAGIGLYYKGQDGFGGYIAPKLVTYDYTQHVKTK